ncbi:GTPase HflX [Cohnella cholangitidis]|uniref:GTPase HflX n=1 Tax=Cohnella cholangitidis TaxID=2598458 RepID=A0A7G5C768_9BACL|nr:GTPase HflX [Cohnella cholangitidis]QMV45052.1 GTPase HflX [Cohnella cholangitidis]
MNRLQREKAITVGVQLNHRPDFTGAMAELRSLAEACEIDVAGELVQKAERVNPSLYMGSGKIKELKELMASVSAGTAIFNDELSPSQIRNLEAELDCRVIDRTILILDIFSSRAQTREAKLQVEVARLQYMLPRLVGLRESLGRQGGGAGLKNRGSGETKLELDRRRIEDRIAALQADLEKLVARRHVQRKQRLKNEVPVVCLVGYTNAGKSSLMNALVKKFNPGAGKEVLAKDMLFATLETSVRSIELPNRRSFLLADTVGFVSQLPHHLIKAFRSTLEEVIEADLLLHVIDCSDADFESRIHVTNETLQELGAGDLPALRVYNKTDLTERSYPKIDGNEIYLSAENGSGIEDLVQLVSERIFSDYKEYEIVIPYDRSKLVSYFKERAHVHAMSHEEDGTRLTMTCREADYDKISGGYGFLS